MGGRRSRRQKGTGSISTLADGRADAELKIRRLDGSVRRLRKRLSSTAEAEVEAKDGWGRLTAAFAHADMDLEGASVQATQLPTWEGGHIPVSDGD
jgi:hypothetical protein